MSGEAWPARHRFFVERPLSVGVEVRLDLLSHQLVTVLRLQHGDSITLINGDGCEYLVRLIEASPRRAAGQVIDLRTTDADPRIHLTLYQCTLKQDKFDWVLQKATELGVAHIVPVVSQRSVVRSASALANKWLRWQTILREATEQCGRTRPPTLAQAVEANEVRLPADTRGFLAWEAADRDAPPLGCALSTITAGKPMALLVGPEGGLAREEVLRFVTEGWLVVRLGKRILRAETAAIAGIAVIMERFGELT